MKGVNITKLPGASYLKVEEGDSGEDPHEECGDNEESVVAPHWPHRHHEAGRAEGRGIGGGGGGGGGGKRESVVIA